MICRSLDRELYVLITRGRRRADSQFTTPSRGTTWTCCLLRRYDHVAKEDSGLYPATEREPQCPQSVHLHLRRSNAGYRLTHFTAKWNVTGCSKPCT